MIRVKQKLQADFTCICIFKSKHVVFVWGQTETVICMGVVNKEHREKGKLETRFLLSLIIYSSVVCEAV